MQLPNWLTRLLYGPPLTPFEQVLADLRTDTENDLVTWKFFKGYHTLEADIGYRGFRIHIGASAQPNSWRNTYHCQIDGVELNPRGLSRLVVAAYYQKERIARNRLDAQAKQGLLS